MGLEGYRLLGQLGAGRDGVAYRAEPLGGGESVALVRLDQARADAARWSQLTRRLALAAGLCHRSVRAIREIGLDDEPPYLVLARDDHPPLFNSAFEGRAVAIVGEIAAALAAAHRLGLVHGRLDPWTILGHDAASLSIDFTGIDAGSAPVVSSDRRLTPEAFRAPEIRAGPEPTAESDIYSLGALAAWLVTGQPPDSFHDSERDLHPSPRAIVEAMLSPDPFDRPSAQEAERRLVALFAQVEASPTATDLASGPATSEWSTASPGPETVEVAASSAHLDGLGGRASIRLTAGATLPGSASGRVAPGSLGRYRLIGKLGEGGMGEVFKAIDEADGSTVAVKLLRPELADRPNSLKRFRKEARLLARVRNPYVTNLLDVNEDQGLHYIVLEFVAGESLDRTLAARGRFDERTALTVATDIARGLMDAHRLGIVHRDVKPSNVLLVGELSSTAAEAGAPCVKLSDFGLARHSVEDGSQLLTQSGVIVGTPSYMAPEQCSGGSVDARAGVYALGATLFHLVAGRPPFEADDWRGVIARHLNEPPPPLRSINSEVSEGLARVVEKALAKAPEARYADAEALLHDLDRLLRGEPTGLPMHPLLPEADPGKVLTFDFSWDLDAPPRRLWPLVSNTDRLDRAIGFSPVRYTLKYDSEKGVRRFLKGRSAGMDAEGEELPYEWVEGRRLGVFREYAQGPFKWIVSVVELAPRGSGATLTHRLRIEPRGRLVRLGSRWGVGSRLKRDLERVYRRIDAAVTGKLGQAPALDPFEPPPTLAKDRRLRLDGLLAGLVGRGLDPDVVEALGGFIADAPDQELARIRPIALARRFGLPEEATVSACLHAANAGLLVLLWDLLCPICRIPSDVKETLQALSDHARCEACQLDYQLDFANSVELVFRAHPQVREADTETYCAAGPAHSPHVVAQVRVAPGERMELELVLSDGAYRLRGPQLGWTFDFLVRSGEAARRWSIGLAHGPAAGLAPVLRDGGQVLELLNDTDCPLVVRVERAALRVDALTAARASSLAVFRELFPAEVLAPGRLVSVASVTLLVTALDPRPTSLYEELGDARAFAALHEQFRLIDGVVRREGGALVKTLGEGVLAVFSDPDAAVRAALTIPDALRGGEATRDLGLHVAIHSGPAMAATLNDHLDYFGTTVHQAIEALAQSPAGSLVLTRPVAADPIVAARLGALGGIAAILPSEARACTFGPLLCLDLRRNVVPDVEGSMNPKNALTTRAS
jgi:eukaryotic-like serine/threonine-protein kinase